MRTYIRITYEDRVVIETLRQESQTKHLQHQIIACLIDWQLLVIAHFLKFRPSAREITRGGKVQTHARTSCGYPPLTLKDCRLQGKGKFTYFTANPERSAPKNRCS
jgi:hypothetical protein